MKVIGAPDCSSGLKLIKSQYKNSELKYSENQIEKQIGIGYLSFFQETSQTICKVEQCLLKKLNCHDISEQDDVIIHQFKPFIINAKTNKPQGYSHMFCLECGIGNNTF